MPPAPSVSPSEARAIFAESLTLIHDHPEERGLIHTEIQRWYDIFFRATGIDAFTHSVSDSIILPTGKAIGPSAAAACLLEAQRTAVFLRGIEHAIRDLQHLFPNQRIRILYAGCGPYASLLTPLTARFSPDEVGFHLLDINPLSLASAQRLFQTLDIEPYLIGTQLADAATLTLPTSEPFHIVLSETMQRALQDEPQLAIMLNLLPQLQFHAVFIPQRIAIRAALLRWPPDDNPNTVRQPTLQDLGPIYEVGSLPALPPQETHITVPALTTPGHLNLTTHITVYKYETLSNNDTSITLPQDHHRQLQGNEHLTITYQQEPRPTFISKIVDQPIS